jgi:hypothetical protein
MLGEPKVVLLDETYVIAMAASLAKRADLAAPGTKGEVLASLADHIAAHPEDRGKLIVVPEDDFIGFVASNNRVALALSGVIVLLVIVLAALLVLQGMRSDRSVRRVAERGRAIEKASAAYTAISEHLAEHDGQSAAAASVALAGLTEASRVGVWSLTRSGRVLHCIDSFDAEPSGRAP